MSTTKNLIHSDTFSARLQAIESLRAISRHEVASRALKEIAVDLDSLSIIFASTAAAKSYAALASLLRILDTLVLWREAVLGAEADADRFLRSAQERFSLWRTEFGQADAARPLITAASGIECVSSIADVGDIARSICQVPMPIGVFAREVRPTWAPPATAHTREEEIEDLTVAFLKFQIDGMPASEVHQVTPGEVHDLEIEVRVSRWPDGQAELQLTPISVEPKSTYEFPMFRFDRPTGEAPYVMHQNGRAVLLLPQGMHARPFEFKYTAEFLPEKGDQPVAIVGHRTLIFDGADLASFHRCGYPSLDQRLIRIRDALRRRSGVPQSETADALRVLAPLCNLAGRAVQDAEFSGPWTEAEFQRHVRAELRRHPLIGTDLDEHAHGGGGITDLSLRGLPIELKVLKTRVTSIDECSPFLAQAASYAVAKSKQTAILCVLDTSEKHTSPLPAEALLGVKLEPTSGIMVCVLVIQGHLARPSALSR